MLWTRPKYYKDCSELNAGLFFKIIKTGDLSLLCYAGRLKHNELKEIWGSIEIEYQQLTQKQEYYQGIAKTNNECVKVTRINALVTLYYMMKYAPDDNFEEFKKYWGVEHCDLNGIISLILQEKTKFSIRRIKDKEKQELKESAKKPMTIERLKILVVQALNIGYIDFEKISVRDWVEMCAMVEEKAKTLDNGKRTD